MSFLATLFGSKLAVNAVTSVAETVGSTLGDLFTSDDERLTHQEVLARIKQQPYLAQIKLNMVEAQHRSMFVAGWRPFIGWTCGVGIGYHFILQPLIAWGVVVWGPALAVAPPVLEFAPLLSLVMSLLGLGALRTVEKARGLTK